MNRAELREISLRAMLNDDKTVLALIADIEDLQEQIKDLEIAFQDADDRANDLETELEEFKEKWLP